MHNCLGLCVYAQLIDRQLSIMQGPQQQKFRDANKNKIFRVSNPSLPRGWIGGDGLRHFDWCINNENCFDWSTWVDFGRWPACFLSEKLALNYFPARRSCVGKIQAVLHVQLSNLVTVDWPTVLWMHTDGDCYPSTAHAACGQCYLSPFCPQIVP